MNAEAVRFRCEDTGGQIAGDTDVESPVALAGENIDMIAMRHGLF